MVRGHEGRAVAELRPGLSRKAGVGFGEDLTRHRDVMAWIESEEGTRVVERCQGFGLVPGQGSTESPTAAAKIDRFEVVGRGTREARTGEAKQHATAVDETRQPVVRCPGHLADIGQHQHGRVFVERRHDGIARADPDFAHIGERGQGLDDEVAGAQQRLCRIGAGPAHHIDAPPFPASVEQRHGTGRRFSSDRHAGNVVAQFDRQREHALGGVTGREGERRIADRQPFEVIGP